ncbi:helix-turn-helix domain-containing protein, partial [Streptomyces olivaceus]|uniref:helix-turn-helix domain-containing protein n=1 Tax=Streptomyces olivaceus TaxID=47716 RepID=UPI004055CDE6
MWHKHHRARLASRPRKRAVGAGAKHRLAFVDRLLATLVHLRHGVTHNVLACWFGWIAPPSPGPSVRYGPCSLSEAAPSAPMRDCGPWPTSSTTSARAGRPALLSLFHPEYSQVSRVWTAWTMVPMR